MQRLLCRYSRKKCKEFYAGKIILENLQMIHKEFEKQHKNKVLMKIDYPLANSYFQKISSIVGEEKMEDFNNIMAEAFVFEGVGLLAAQHCMVRAVGMLLYRDPESSKQILSVDDGIVKFFKLYFFHTNIKICMKKVDSFLLI